MYAVCKIPGIWKCAATGKDIRRSPGENEIVRIRSAKVIGGHTFYDLEGYGKAKEFDGDILFHSISFVPVGGLLAMIKLDICLN